MWVELVLRRVWSHQHEHTSLFSSITKHLLRVYIWHCAIESGQEGFGRKRCRTLNVQTIPTSRSWPDRKLKELGYVQVNPNETAPRIFWNRPALMSFHLSARTVFGGNWGRKATIDTYSSGWTKLKRKRHLITWCECTLAADLKLLLLSPCKDKILTYWSMYDMDFKDSSVWSSLCVICSPPKALEITDMMESLWVHSPRQYQYKDLYELLWNAGRTYKI